MHVLVQVGCVALGSSLGGLLRWGVSVALARWLGTAFPWGTFFINLSGSFFLGWFSTLLTERYLQGSLPWISADNLRLLVAVGFTGAYTTFSTFEYETHALLSDGQGIKGSLYVLGSVVLGLVAAHLGIVLARLKGG